MLYKLSAIRSKVKIMSDEINRESTTKKVTSNSNTPMSGDNSSSGLILGVLLALFLGAGAVAYFMNNRQAPTQILVLMQRILPKRINRQQSNVVIQLSRKLHLQLLNLRPKLKLICLQQQHSRLQPLRQQHSLRRRQVHVLLIN